MKTTTWCVEMKTRFYPAEFPPVQLFDNAEEAKELAEKISARYPRGQVYTRVTLSGETVCEA